MNFSHLLTENGILVSFNIAKKVKAADIRKIKSKLKLLYGDDDEKLLEELENLIVLHTKNTIDHNKIPGLILNKQKTSKKEKSKKQIKNPYDLLSIEMKEKLISLSLLIGRTISDNKLSTEYILILIQMIISQFGINQEDINKFQQKYKNEEFQDEDDENEEGDTPFF